MNEQWMQDMRQKMAGYQRPAPEVSWDKIDQVLTSNKPRKLRSFWLRRIAAAAAVILVSGVGYWTFMRDKTEPKQPTVATVGTRQQPIEKDVDKSHTIHVHDSSAPDESPLRNLAQTLSRTLTGDFSNIESKQDSVLAVVAETVTAVPTTNTDTVFKTSTTEERPQTVEEKVKPLDHTRRIVYPTAQHQRTSINNRLTAQVYYSNTMSDKSSSQSFTNQIGQTIYENPNNSWGSFSPTETNTQTKQIEKRVHHRQPVRFGFSLRYQINDRWSVESGLSYTHLSSEITTIEDKTTTVTEQKLNYIGLPLNVGYDLWHRRYFGLYVMAGGMLEKCLDACPWQFSVNAGVGAEYKVTNNFGLYAEPGVGYFFSNGSSIPTIYQDRPLNFNLNVGLRFHLK